MAKKDIEPWVLTHDPELPPVAQAVSLALALLSLAGVDRWSELPGKLGSDQRVELTDEQVALLDRHEADLHFIRQTRRASSDGSVTAAPMVTIVVCPTCRRWLLIPSGTGERKKCETTRGCLGRPVRVKKAEHRRADRAAANPDTGEVPS